MKVDPRFLKEEGIEVFLGNELLIKGLLEVEGGTHLWTGYPGSPVAGFFDCIESIQELPKKYGIHAAMANNEALSVAMVNGSQMSGLRAIAAMKSVGVHVASDALALGNLAGAHPDGGAVIVLGDDPWSESTQVPADSRYICKHLMMPVLEPSTFQEVKDWIDTAFKLSRRSELYIGYLLTPNHADGGASVLVRKNQFPEINTNNKTTLDTKNGLRIEDMVLLPPRTWRKEQDMPSRVERLWKAARELGVNQFINRPAAGQPKAPLGFIAAGMSYNYLQHTLYELGVNEKIPQLKLGLCYPIDPALIEEFSESVENIIIIEERRGFVEEQVAQIIIRRNQKNSSEKPIQVFGKEFPNGLEGIPSIFGLNPSILVEKIAPLLKQFAQSHGIQIDQDMIDGELNLIDFTSKYEVDTIARTPTFCPGCPHRDSASVLMDVKKAFMDKDYMRKNHRRDPTDLVFHGDTGCYTMLMFEPTKDLMHNYSGMGLGGGTGAGIDPFIKNKQVVFMGDGTFFHSGQLSITNAIKNRQDITFIILDNKTTAMTGHQPTPSVDYDLLGRETFAQDIEKVVQGMVEAHTSTIVRTNPAYRESYRELLEETILKDGVKVIIADKECGITYHRKQLRDERAEIKAKGFLESKTFINITPDVCENCLECTKSTGCPGLIFVDTDYGRKIQTDLSWCVADTACTKLHVCPSFEEVTIFRKAAPPNPLDAFELTGITEPRLSEFKHSWKIFLAGVGGMGIATSTAILVRAGHKEGFNVMFAEKNGLAIRNGGVYSLVTFLKPGQNHSSQISSYGKADALLGIDILEATRSLDPKGHTRIASPDYTTAVINTEKTPTIMTLLGREDFDVSSLEKIIRRYTKPSTYFSFNVSQFAEKIFGTKLYVNIMMIGIAYQKGLLPMSVESIEWAIRETTGGASLTNLKAFALGRKMVCDPQLFGFTPANNYLKILEEKAGILAIKNQALAQSYRDLVEETVQKIQIDSDGHYHLAIRLYDCIQFQNMDYAKTYISMLTQVYQKDSKEFGYLATKAVIQNLAKVMCIKDEFYVAHLLTSEEKLARDRQRYTIDPKRGDKITYTHLNKPHYEFFGHSIDFRINTKNWMLSTLKRMKFLRPFLGSWHFGHEKAFRDWYISLVREFHLTTAKGYELTIQILRLPESVSGYYTVSRPKMQEAKERADYLKDVISSLPAQQQTQPDLSKK